MLADNPSQAYLNFKFFNTCPLLSLKQYDDYEYGHTGDPSKDLEYERQHSNGMSFIPEPIKKFLSYFRDMVCTVFVTRMECYATHSDLWGVVRNCRNLKLPLPSFLFFTHLDKMTACQHERIEEWQKGHLLEVKFKMFELSFKQQNGMLRHSLATLEGEQDFIFLYRALLSPLSLLL